MVNLNVALKSLPGRSEKPKVAEWVLFGVIAFISMLFFSQGFDLSITAQHSLSLLDAISKGKFFHFYAYVYNIAMTGGYGGKGVQNAAFYSVLLYLTFSVWNLPLWAFTKITGIHITAFKVMMWDKVFVFLVFLLCAWVLYQIGLTLGMKNGKSKWMAFVFLTSPIIMFGAIIFSQYDLFSVLFTLLALWMYLRKKPYAFSMLMAVAICYKNFSVMVFLPLLLLSEKRVLHICKHILIGASLMLLQLIMFSFDPYYKITQDTLNKMYGFTDRILASGMPTGFGTAFFIGIAIFLLCVFAYWKQVRSDRELAQYAIWLPLAAYGFFFCFIAWHPQWVVILVPFLVLGAFYHNNFKLSIFLEIGISICYMFVAVMSFVKNVDQNMVNGGILPRIFKVIYDAPVTLSSLISKTGLPIPVFITFFLAGIFAVIILNFPYFNRLEGPGKSHESVFLPERSVLWVRALTVFAYIAPTLALYFYHLIKIR